MSDDLDRFLEPQPRWRTPDEAIAATVRSPLDARGIDLRKLPGGQAQAQEAMHAYSQVQAILGAYDDRTRLVLIGWAVGMGYTAIERHARKLGIQGASRRTLRRIHRPAWEEVRRRLLDLGLIGE